jgi:hypothetical protein
MHARKLSSQLIMAVFLLAITAPLALMVSGRQHPAVRENRRLSPMPVLRPDAEHLKRFPHDFFCFFRDNFGFRDTLIRLNFVLRRDLFKEAIFNDVVFGKGGWLFYQGEREMDDARGITQYDEPTLRRWTDSLEAKRRWLASRGIRYLFVVVPSKETVYGEYLPDYLGKVHAVTGMDQFLTYLRSHSQVSVVDLREGLFAAKRTGRVFEKTDTHWSQLGAFAGYQQVMGRLGAWFPLLHAAPLSDFSERHSVQSGGDLAALVGGDAEINEEEVRLEPRVPLHAHPAGGQDGESKSLIMQQDAPGLPRTLVFRDSFFDALLPFFSEKFQYAHYLRKHWDQSVPIARLIRENRPDVVIEEFAERRIKMDMGMFAEPE